MLPSSGGPRRQVDLRRAISNTYYALFHFIMTAAADEFVGATHQKGGRYRLMYRSIDHRTLSTVCGDVKKSPPPIKYAPYFSAIGLGGGIRAFAFAAQKLQQRRHSADYDPGTRFKIADAEIAIRTAREAMNAFRNAPDAEKKAFLTLLVCPPR